MVNLVKPQLKRSRGEIFFFCTCRILVMLAISLPLHGCVSAFSVTEKCLFGQGLFGKPVQRSSVASSRLQSRFENTRLGLNLPNQDKALIGVSCDDGSPFNGRPNIIGEENGREWKSTKHFNFQQSVITPYHIFHPRVSQSVFEYPVAPAPLYRALGLIKEALQVMANSNLDGFPGIVRMEHPVTHGSVDPLAWISAQQQRLRTLSPQSFSSFYCQNQEQDFEVAALGAVHTCNATNQVWSFLEGPDWPRSSRWYGGQRFDASLEPNQQSPEWKDFSGRNGAWWFLPAIELRQEAKETVISVHVTPQNVQKTFDLLGKVTDQCMERRPPTTLPPLLSRSTSFQRSDGVMYDGQELYEEAVTKAIEAMEANNCDISDEHGDKLKKVVLARVQRMRLGVSDFCALAVLRKWKYGGNEGGHLFWMQPGGEALPALAGTSPVPEFFGCSPERLFRVKGGPEEGRMIVESEALAGTRPRGSTSIEDTQLLRDLMESPKDRRENQITGDYIGSAFSEMHKKGWIVSAGFSGSTEVPLSQQFLAPFENGTSPASGMGENRQRPTFFVRRLLHLQHLCQSFKAHLTRPSEALNATRFLLTTLHPTPAVCGAPLQTALKFIREYESVGFDRGFYAGPVGYIGLDASDVFVALRSALLTQEPIHGRRTNHESSLSVYAGAGIVPGSTVKGEWAETNFKLAVISSVFPQSPMTLQGAQTPNVAWATAFVEELIRNGVTQFYVCPGSRSTPLVVALSRAARAHVGVVHLTSVHDERAAAFRAVGYGRGANRPAAVVTSSGTAVANLYPAVVEAGTDGVPLLLLTADRPYENRDTGANQAIDQVKMFSSSYVRWFRDILPPSDTVPISLVLSDAGHAVKVARGGRGPVHLNIQFRENLAPDGGPIRNDNRPDSVTEFNAAHFTETPKFARWSVTGKAFQKDLKSYVHSETSEASIELAQLIRNSRRGLIVVGNVRSSLVDAGDSQVAVTDAISDFAQHIGFPIIAGAQQVTLRFRSPSIILFAEHLLKCPLIAKSLNPDLIIQIGAPIVSSEVPSIISKSIKGSNHQRFHVLIHPSTVNERIDPSFTVTHHISADCPSFLKAVASLLVDSRGSELSPLVTLGRLLQAEMKQIIQKSSADIASKDSQGSLSEPEVILAMAESYDGTPARSLFLSNSMPIRDSEFFLYPFSNSVDFSVIATGSNRGASGIDGIISSAAGFAEGIETPTTLVIGDVSALHDIGSLHRLAEQGGLARQGARKRYHPVTTIVVNNDGGGIFSFLPIAQHGKDVSFDEFFGTPTNSFSFEKGADAFGLPYRRVDDYDTMVEAFVGCAQEKSSSLVEAIVMTRESNVLVHRRITQEVGKFIESLLAPADSDIGHLELSRVNTFSNDFYKSTLFEDAKTLVLLHGWMGDKSDWDEVALSLTGILPPSWSVKAIDLAGHGEFLDDTSNQIKSIRQSLKLSTDGISQDPSVQRMADTVVNSLASQGVNRIDALVGYSLGGRVALAMYDRFQNKSGPMTNETKLVLLSSFAESQSSIESSESRLVKDDNLSEEIIFGWLKSCLKKKGTVQEQVYWDHFLDKWYSSPIWGDIQSMKPYPEMKKKRSTSLQTRGPDLAAVLSACSPPRNKRSLEGVSSPASILMIAGESDRKYYELGMKWRDEKGIEFDVVPNAGHAVVVEKPLLVAEKIADFLSRKNRVVHKPSKVLSGEVACRSESDATVFSQSTKNRGTLSIRFQRFSLGLHSGKRNSVSGIGWGEKSNKSTKLSSRDGYILQLENTDEAGMSTVGVGEIGPLNGLHHESLADALAQIEQIESFLNEKTESGIYPDPLQLLQLRGYMSDWMKRAFPDVRWLPSVRSGFEMALLGISAHKLRMPIHQAILQEAANAKSTGKCVVEVNGLMPRGSGPEGDPEPVSFRSLKIKVGHQSPDEDISSIRRGLYRVESDYGQGNGKVRLDANRAWNWTESVAFAHSLKNLKFEDRVEFIEEPLSKILEAEISWSFEAQVDLLEAWFNQTALPYALDESLADLAYNHGYQYEPMKDEILKVFESGARGCKALVLKPALLGVELAMQLSRLARQVGMSAVYSSSFDSGIGLAYTAFLAAASDAIEGEAQRLSHGIGTFVLLEGDTLSPSFSSYMNENGQLNVSPISRAMYGLTLDELLVEKEKPKLDEQDVPRDSPESLGESELSTVVSLSLPFSAEIAHIRFTDLPQQPRWSPWLSSVSYQGEESEWKINVRGIQFKWRAKSELLSKPWLGIRWESVSGVANRGSVEFIPISGDACEMKVRIIFVAPRILTPLFRRAKSIFLEDFIRDKIVKWSIEMFRDVVKADLAIERGDVELGDALYGAVEGKASAIEATLKGSSRNEE